MGQISLLIVTTNRVLVASTSAKGGDARTIDEMGCGLGCAVMDWDRREMIVARDEAVYVYGAEGRGACYAYEGELLIEYQGQLVLMIRTQELYICISP